MDEQPHRSKPVQPAAPATHAERLAAARRDREAAALRANLARRKAQTRERNANDDSAVPASTPDGSPCR